MQVLLRCPGCRAALPVDARSAPERLRCGGCGRELALELTPAVREDRLVDRCPLCRGGDFYVRKDFDPKLGLLVVACGAVVSGALYATGRDAAAYAVLAAAVLLDVVIYGRLRDVTVCYRCHAEFRGAYRRTAGAFDLHVADELEPEWERRIGRR
ncbi:MAG TPA: hypothetical protein VNI83_14300 [Vicinamibacterales bacterium]|nr:hypothetical protein [Vicinamibacterales bacterium]